MREEYTVAANIVRESRLARKRLEEELEQRLAPHRVMVKQISGLYADRIEALESTESAALGLWRELHSELTEARRAALLRGEQSPALELPENVSVREDRVVEVTNAELLPAEFLQPNMAAIKKFERHVPGTSVSIRPTLVCR